MTENPSVADEHPLLRVSGATVVFGGVVAVGDVSLTVERGEILGLVGPNGAGKSTLFGAIAGAVPLKSGTVELRGERVSGRRPHQMSRLGVARTFQKVRLFNTLTATENVLVAARSHERSLSRARQITEESLEIAGFRADRGVPTTSLPLADRKRVEIARAIAAKPQLLLLDEMMN
ncbi:MAG TPA: ATP-binding cassette domain-containing protein, partial [Pseudolysinimonas sp.]|nr:ATP-binding cassette domain-containing protein [Pseudolysinimonas sp.]